MSDEERIKRVEEAIIIMKDLVIRYDERIDTFAEDLKQSREEFDFKMNAVIDAQIRNDEQIAELKISVNKLEISSRQLEIASRSQLGRIEKLEAV